MKSSSDSIVASITVVSLRTLYLTMPMIKTSVSWNHYRANRIPADIDTLRSTLPWLHTSFVNSQLGILSCLDGYMNIALENTEEYVNGVKRNSYGDAFVRGNNGKMSSVILCRDYRLLILLYLGEQSCTSAELNKRVHWYRQNTGTPRRSFNQISFGWNTQGDIITLRAYPVQEVSVGETPLIAW